MPTTTITKYCCGVAQIQRDLTAGVNCGNTYTVQNLTVTSGNNFGTWTDGELLSRTCATVTCTGATVSIFIETGCIPKSLDPLVYNLDVYENGTFFAGVGGPYNIITDCPDGDCPLICN